MGFRVAMTRSSSTSGSFRVSCATGCPPTPGAKSAADRSSVACDPAPLARDIATVTEHGYAWPTAFGAFPMTHHVCVALLQ
jgi:hypothetical protein